MSGRIEVCVVGDDEATREYVARRLETECEAVSAGATTSPEALHGERVAEEFDCLLVSGSVSGRTGAALVGAVRDHDGSFPVVVDERGGAVDGTTAGTGGAVERGPVSDGTRFRRLGERVEAAVANGGEGAERAVELAAGPGSGGRPATWGEVVDAADFVLDPSCHLESWPDRLNDLTGLTDETLRETDLLDLVVPDDRQALREAVGECLGRGSVTVTLRVETSEGGSYPFELRAVRVTESSGRVAGICGVSRDVVTDEPDAETFDRRARRLEAAVTEVDGPGTDGER